MKLKIHVTADDIAKGQRNHSLRCPIARALKRAATDASGRPDLRVRVNWLSVSIREPLADNAWADEILVAQPTPRLARRFVNKFDNAEPVKPFTFSLEV